MALVICDKPCRNVHNDHFSSLDFFTRPVGTVLSVMHSFINLWLAGEIYHHNYIKFNSEQQSKYE